METIDLDNLEEHCIMSDLEEEGNGLVHTTDLGLMKVKSSMPKATTPVPRVPLKLSKYETEIDQKDA